MLSWRFQRSRIWIRPICFAVAKGQDDVAQANGLDFLSALTNLDNAHVLAT
jgi:hypothetical protein